MNKTSNKNIKYLMLTLAVMFLLSVWVNLLMNRTGMGSTGSSRSGMFINTSQSIGSGGWYFYAEEANGHSTFFANLRKEELESIIVESQITRGEMTLVITQEDKSFTYNLSETKEEKIIKEINASVMEPGRIEMRLYFTYAQEINVVVSWRD